MRDTTWDEIERPYDGCGKCLLGVRRLPRMKAATSSGLVSRIGATSSSMSAENRARYFVPGAFVWWSRSGHSRPPPAPRRSPRPRRPPGPGRVGPRRSTPSRPNAGQGWRC